MPVALWMESMSRYDLLARNVLSSTLGIQPGDDVIVETWDDGLPIADALIYRLRELGARPMLLFEHEEAFWKGVGSLPEDKLGKVGEHEWAAIEKANGYVFIPGPADIQKIWKNRSKFGAATSYDEEWYERAKRYRLKAARIGFLQDGIAAGAVTVAIGGNDDLGGANKTDFYFPGILTKATLSVDDNPIVENGKLVL